MWFHTAWAVRHFLLPKGEGMEGVIGDFGRQVR